MRDQLRFLMSLAARPRMTGAIAPSGPALAKMMASHVDPNGTLPVIELGPGTGVVTRALIEHGVAPGRIVAIEYSPEFCAMIRERFPGVTVIEGDAYDLDRTLGGRAPFIQFSYIRKGPIFPVPPTFTAEASGWIWKNAPPARVWLYRPPA